MRILFTLLLLLLPLSPEPWTHQLDLEPMLRDTQRLQKLTIMYESPLEQGFQTLFVYGNGHLVRQTDPGGPMAKAGLSRCEAEVEQNTVRQLVRLMLSRHFWELPEKGFLEVNGRPSNKVLALHRIFISDGIETAARVFGVGTYLEKQESIPDDFATIEKRLKKLAESNFSNKACRLAPPMDLRNM